MSTSVDWVALSLLPARWRGAIGEKLRASYPPDEIIKQLLTACPDTAGLTISAVRTRAAAALARAEHAGLGAVNFSEAAYPPMLAAIVDPPPVLWIRGTSAALGPPAVAIVGSRAGSPYALAVAEQLAADLASRGIIVVSGLARGVDSAAHRGALSAASTVAVLGSGVDVVYPREHADLAREISVNGALVSELVPGTPPQQRFFPMRNRIISGLSRAVVVIEAGEKSGSLITARSALDQGRDVLAVPGSVLNGRNRGGHGLLRDGAKIVESADDILEELGFQAPGRCVSRSGCPSAAGMPSRPPDPVLGCLPPGEPCNLDVIADRSGVAVPRLLPRLLELELQGLVRRAGSGCFVRLNSSC
jgi:DNA processing protein